MGSSMAVSLSSRLLNVPDGTEPVGARVGPGMEDPHEAAVPTHARRPTCSFRMLLTLGRILGGYCPGVSKRG